MNGRLRTYTKNTLDKYKQAGYREQSRLRKNSFNETYARAHTIDIYILSIFTLTCTITY